MVLGVPNFGGGDRGSIKKERESATRFLSTPNYKPNTPEAKAAKSFLNMLNVLSFDPAVFAWIFTQNALAVQKRALECLIAVIDMLALHYDKELHNSPEEYDFYIKAKRAQDAMAVYRENGMLP